MRAENAPTTASRSAAGSTSAISSTSRPDPRNPAHPSTSSGVYVEPPPTTAILMLLSLHSGQRDALYERALCEEEDDDDRDHGQHGCRGHQVPVHVVDGVERRQAQRQRPVRLVLAG